MFTEDNFQASLSRRPESEFGFPDPNKNPSPLRYPALDNHAYIWIILVVIIPVIFAIILCLITICVYRYRKGKAQNSSSTASITQIESYPSSANIFVVEEQPPSYDILSEKNPNTKSYSMNRYINEQTTPSSIRTERTNVN